MQNTIYEKQILAIQVIIFWFFFCKKKRSCRSAGVAT